MLHDKGNHVASFARAKTFPDFVFAGETIKDGVFSSTNGLLAL
jgi:hypothetical protein